MGKVRIAEGHRHIDLASSPFRRLAGGWVGWKKENPQINPKKLTRYGT